MRISNLFEDKDIIDIGADKFTVKWKNPPGLNRMKKSKINVIATGNVGQSLVLGLMLSGEQLVEEIGIWDLNRDLLQYVWREMNQIPKLQAAGRLPKVKILEKDEIFDCHILAFCGSKGVPSILKKNVDVRMAQLEANKDMVREYGLMAVSSGFAGRFAMVADPVDPLCKVLIKTGLKPWQVSGFGLGVMYGRALFHSEDVEEFEAHGRVFGPHGGDLVVANNVYNYDHDASQIIRHSTVNENLKIRELGYKPYIAPALASGALSLMDMAAGRYHYSSVFFGKEERGSFLGVRNRLTDDGVEIEDLNLDERLYRDVERAYKNLSDLQV